MKLNKCMVILLIMVFFNFLLGCRQIDGISEQQEIEIIDEEGIEEAVGTIDDGLENEFDDGLDEALQELEDIEDI